MTEELGQTVNATCPSCGAHHEVAALSDAMVREGVRTVIREELRDRDVVEVELAALAAGRLADWTKVFGVAVGVPLALLLALLGLLGVTQYSDVSEALERARKDAEKLVGDARQIETELVGLREVIPELTAIRDRIKSIDKDLQEVRDAVGLKPSAVLTPERERELKALYSSFRDYLVRVGFRIAGPIPELEVVPGAKDGYFTRDAKAAQIVIGEDIVNDRDSLVHEYVHYAQFYEAPRLWDSTSGAVAEVAEAMADYYAASYTNDPVLGEASAAARGIQTPYLRNLKNDRAFSVVPKFLSDVEVWGALLWELRTQAGEDVADRVVLSWWRAIAAEDAPTRARVGGLLVAEASKHSESLGASIRAAIANRRTSQN